MFQKVIRAARPAILAARSSLKPSTSTLRAFSTTFRVQSDGPPPPQLYGEGGKAGSVPTDIEQATGLERLQLLGDMEGVKLFDDGPLDSSRIGTKVNPVLVPSYVRGNDHFQLWYSVTDNFFCIFFV
jgi:cytochrome c oxidase subunit 5b